MRIPRILLTMALGIGFALGLVASASAGSLKTSALFLGGSQNVCVVINVGTAQTTVTVQMIGLSSTVSDTCVIQPNDIDTSCQLALADFAFCKVTAPNVSIIRAVMINRSTAAPFTIFATSEAR